MGIPPIPPYVMPREEEVVQNVAGWRPDPSRVALLIHDVQQYFVEPFAAGSSPVNDMIDHIAAVRDMADRWKIPVFYTMQIGNMSRRQRGLLWDFWGPGMTTDPKEQAIVGALAPRPADRIITKWRYSAFHRTGLLSALHEAGRDQLMICGVYAHFGCLITAFDSFSHDIETFLLADGVADFTAHHHAMALTNAAEGCAVVLSTRRIIEAIESGDLDPGADPEFAEYSA